MTFGYTAPRRLVVVHETLEDAAILHVFDEVDIAVADQLESEIEAIAFEGRVVIDLLECRYLDSSILRVLMHASERFGDRLRIAVTRGSHIERVLEVTQLVQVLAVVHDLDEARATTAA